MDQPLDQPLLGRGTRPGRGRSGPGTRERVLAVALQLFNTHGPERVTTAEIAAAAGINEGNLYYWFPRKAHIAEALFGELESAMIRVAEREISNPDDPHSYGDYQRGWFSLMSEFRFFYRDGVALRGLAPELRLRMQALNRRTQDAVRRVLHVMRAHGMLRASDEQISVLIANLWIVSGYWMDYYALILQDGTEAAAADTQSDQPAPAAGGLAPDLAWGARQVAALVAPYLTERGASGAWSG